ncbi:MAG: hypothetical protein PHH55_05695 [Candidatus Delongbacteria bacterium]|nr:hypothetical protein [Candidatus Delongbacteria bacterium]
MRELRSVIYEAISSGNTLICDHYFSEIIREPLILEVFPVKLDGDFLVCYDLLARQPYAIYLKNIIMVKNGQKRKPDIPEHYCIISE